MRSRSFQRGCVLVAFVAALLERAIAEVPAAARPPIVGRPAPQVALTGLDGRDMSAASAHGKFLLIAFSDAQSKDEGWRFFRTHAGKFAQLPGMVMHNVIVPGGVLLTPRAVILARVRSDAARLVRELRAGLSAEARRQFDRVELGWHVDFDRHYTDLFGVPPHRIALVLVDPEGRIAAYEETVDAAAVDRLLALGKRDAPSGAPVKPR